jgi:hypothetical protein
MKETIKANDLRIGNLVRNNLSGEILKACDVLCDGINTDKIEGLNYGFIEPIPLTEEWLLKFGFEYRKEILFDGWYSKLINYNSIRIFKDENGFFKYYSSITYIQHVHQLQNLYFALTGEELTIKEQ